MMFRVLAAFSYIVVSGLIVYHTVYAMWESFENPPTFLKTGPSIEAYVCVATTANDVVVSTALMPATFLTIFLELEEHHIGLCSAQAGVALAFADIIHLKLFAASLEGAVNVDQTS
ncbi:hypothetical protein C8Q76DRAFT_799713 [Earliella scabrosa]|nr:hypothetical protein C8Q76DRAFT_799713 [Earliella scabrosa]